MGPIDESPPPYTYVPGGPWPHPISSPGGHAADRSPIAAGPLGPDGWSGSAPYLGGIALFNAGYYWEAHEAWEALWHAEGRRGPTADLLKALIKLAAAGVKVREGRPIGVASHARRAAVLFEAIRAEVGDRLLGLDLGCWATIARRVADDPPVDPGPKGAAVTVVFEFRIDPIP